jgi:hypothetical protein
VIDFSRKLYWESSKGENMGLTNYQESLVDTVGKAWRAIPVGKATDEAEFRAEGEKREAHRKEVFVDAVVKAYTSGASWSAIARTGVSVPTLRKYADEHLIKIRNGG